MKSLSLTILSSVALVTMPFALAEEKCDKKCEVAAKSECAACPVAKAMEALPKISYVIAGENSGCAKSAAAAKEAGKEVKYVVAGKEICCEKTAKDSHIKAVETFVASFANAHSCESSGKTFVGNKDYGCSKHASSVAAIAKKAMEGVKVTHIVAGKEYCCPDTASKAAKDADAKVTYAVAEAKTECATTNRMNVALAKYKAAVQAIAKAEAAESETANS